MTATKVGIVYSTAQLVRRRLILLDHDDADDAEFQHHINDLQPGESWMEIDIDLYNSFKDTDLDNYLVTLLGSPLSDKCIIVRPEDDIIVAGIKADPRIDYHPEGLIIQDEKAVIGEVYTYEQ